MILNGVSSIASFAFENCTSLTNVIIPSSVTKINGVVFNGCPNLKSVYFWGNAPPEYSGIFTPGSGTVYYLPGTTGWGANYGGLPTAFWYQPNPLILGNGSDLGVSTNGFGFTVSWATNISVIVEACTNLVNPDWQPVQTNAITTGSVYFNDPQWTNYFGRFYRVRSP